MNPEGKANQDREKFRAEHPSPDEQRLHALVEDEFRNLLKERGIEIPNLNQIVDVRDRGDDPTIVVELINSYYTIDLDEFENSKVYDKNTNSGTPLTKTEVENLNQKYNFKLLKDLREEAKKRAVERVRTDKVDAIDGL